MATQPVPPDGHVLRRVMENMVVEDPKHPSGWRPSQAVFKDDRRTGSSMSAYLQEFLGPLGLSAADVVHGKGPEWGVAEVKVAELEADDQKVVHDPVEPAVHPCDPAHVLVVGDKAPKARRERWAQQANWAVVPLKAG